MPDETSPATSSGAAQPEGQTSGSSESAGGRETSEKTESPTLNRDAIWTDARKHYEPLAKKAQEEAAALRRELARYRDAEKTADDFKADAEKYRAQAEAQAEIIQKFAEDGIGKLPEHLQGTLRKAAGDDPLRALSLLPDFQDLAVKQPLKTPGGSQHAGESAKIDIDGIKREQARGNMKPYRDAVEKFGEQAFSAALQEWVAKSRR